MSFIIIGGAARSGTTLLNTLMCSDERVNPTLPECELWRRQLELFVWGFKNWTYRIEGYWLNQQDYLEHVRQQLRDHVDRVRTLHQCEVVVFKEPMVTPLLPYAHEFLPELKSVILLRDPRDIAASLCDVGEKGVMFLQQLKSEPRKLGAFINQHYGSLWKWNQPRDRVSWWRYEDLVTQPETMAALEAWVGLKFRPGVLRYYPEPDADRPWKGRHIGKAPTGESVGRWKEVLTPEQITAIEQECRILMEAGGYVPVGGTSSGTPASET